MKLRNLILPLVLLVLLGVGTCQAAECPIEVKVKLQPMGPADITITSVADVVTVQNVVINRGNVKPFDFSDTEGIKLAVSKAPPNEFNPFYALENPPPLRQKTLKFGETWMLLASTSTIKELEVQTNMGNWKFTFK